MIVSLITEKKYISLNLPEKISGKYWIVDKDQPEGLQNIIAVEAGAEGNYWKIRASLDVQLFDNQSEVYEVVLQEGKFYSILLGKEKVNAFIVAEKYSKERESYEKYAVGKSCSINIGRGMDNDIVILNNLVSSQHAVLSFDGSKWTVNAVSGTNGIYVNDYRLYGGMVMKPGDVLAVFDFKIVFGQNFIAMNNPLKRIRINTDKIRKVTVQNKINSEIYLPRQRSFYYRSPHFKKNITPFSIKVDVPTQQIEIEGTSMLLSMAPAMVMGVAAFSSGIIGVMNGLSSGGKFITVLPSLIMALSMLTGMIVFPIIIKNKEKEKKIKKESDRREKYIKYLTNINNEIKVNRGVQEQILRENNESVITSINSEEFWESKVYGFSCNSKDFLDIRLGVGNVRMFEDIKYPEDRFSIDDDYLRGELTKLQKADKILTDVPVCVSLQKNKVIGIVGEPVGLFNMINNILLQLFLYRGYDELKVVCLFDSKDEQHLYYVRTAKHIWSNDGKVRYLATSEEDVRELTHNLKKVYENYKEDKNNDRKVPHYVIFSTSKYLVNKCEVISDILKDEEINGFSMICAYDRSNSLPKECSAIIEVNDVQGVLYTGDSGDGRKINFVQDEISLLVANKIMRRLLEYSLDLNQGHFDLPEMISFLDMYGVGKCEHLNVRHRWKENNPIMSLKAPVGIGVNGDISYLDLHEKFHGPHGLVAGMTGSGKSEFIITYILSMAVNYHPDEVAFVLIDYKGGGLTGAFDNEKNRLPHLAGTITNLDGNAVTRAIFSIKSELKRRQKIFNEAREKANEGTMDIYKYQKMYRDKVVSEPLPHLFIISDEFAELKSQQPEFLEQLISTARIGRSLGVHLILATQKPSGVVNDQIWSNSKFKVCLKVQDKSDSVEMLKRPDAAELVETGRFYLQIGYNELFELGQSAWCGAPYRGLDDVVSDYDETIEILDNSGNVVDKIQSDSMRAEKSKGKQIVRLMEYLTDIAREDNIKERPLWLPELPQYIPFDGLMKKYARTGNRDDLIGIIGEIDNLYEQRNELLEINFNTGGNAIVFGATGSGEDMLLNTVIYSLYKKYDATRINTYIIDFGTEFLKIYESAPQTGGVVIEGENEKLENLFTMLVKELKRRKKITSDYMGSINEYNNSSNDTLPYILIIINNYSQFIDNYESYEDYVGMLSRDGVKLGIFFMISASSRQAVRYKVQQNFPQSYCLKLNDKTDYISCIGGSTGGLYPNGNYGQGIVKRDNLIYVFQTASIVKSNSELYSFTRHFCEKLNYFSNGAFAKKIPLVPKILTVSECKNGDYGIENIPLGMSLEKYTLETINMKKKNILQILSQNHEEADRYALGLVGLMALKLRAEVVIVDCQDRNYDDEFDNYSIIRANDNQGISDLVDRAIRRNNLFKTENKLPADDGHPVIVWFNNLSQIFVNSNVENCSSNIRIFLDKVEGLCNMCIICSDSYQGSIKYSTDAWYRNRIEGEGVWVGSGVADQIRLQISKNKRNLKNNIDDYTGYFISKGEATNIRLIMPEKIKNEVDADE